LESKKKTFALRISSKAYDALERWAADEFRSVNGQIEMLLDKALREAGRLPALDNRVPKSGPASSSEPDNSNVEGDA
jgi:hypothetical protein